MPPWLEQRDPRFKPLVLPNAPLLTLGEGYGWLEGPVWFADANQLLVSDLPNDRILRWTEGGGMSVFRQPSGFANGHTRDREGRLVGCSHAGRCVTRTEWDGRETVLASHYGGKRLNGPNDVVVAGDGAVWFSDPDYGGNTDYEGGKHPAELPPSLYRLDPGGGLEVVADDFIGPNGLCFAPDGRLLYVCETGGAVRGGPGAAYPGVRGGGGAAAERAGVPYGHAGLCGWHTGGRGWADLEQRRGWGAVHPSGWDASWNDPDGGRGGQFVLRGAQPVSVVHLRVAAVAGGLYQCAGGLGFFSFSRSSRERVGRAPG